METYLPIFVVLIAFLVLQSTAWLLKYARQPVKQKAYIRADNVPDDRC